MEIVGNFPTNKDENIDFQDWFETVKIQTNFNKKDMLMSHVLAMAKTYRNRTNDFNVDCLTQSCLIASLVLSNVSTPSTFIAGFCMEYLRLYGKLPDFEMPKESTNILKNINLYSAQEIWVAIDESLNHYPKSFHAITNFSTMSKRHAVQCRVLYLKALQAICDLYWLKSNTFPRLVENAKNIYLPFLKTIGLKSLTWLIEDQIFRISEPISYKCVAGQLNFKRKEREKKLDIISEGFQRFLNKHGHRIKIEKRVKHIYGIWHKMQRKKVSFDEIYDIRALRVIVLSNEITECFEIAKRVMATWSIIKEEFDDYITTPKSNGYQSIHIALIADDGLPVELQIRTVNMHLHAQLGLAAHWQYKKSYEHILG